MKDLIKKILDKLPYIRTLKNERDSLVEELEIYKTNYPPGHYHSPIVSPRTINGKDIFEINSDKITGVELNESEQLQLLYELSDLYKSVPFKDKKTGNLRYFFDNEAYPYSDAIFLNLMIRHFKPKSIIEIGSGFSSAVMLDTNELFCNGHIRFTFIEPCPERLFSLFKNDDNEKNSTIVKDLQEVDISLFDELNEGDFLFIDSTHVSKTGSDVNKIIFEILPRLKKGVLIHFHDIFYPFEYPKDWVMNGSGFGWNEDYILKAFLMYNNQFEIIMFNTFLEHFHRDWFSENMPNCLKNEGGSIWLKKT